MADYSWDAEVSKKTSLVVVVQCLLMTIIIFNKPLRVGFGFSVTAQLLCFLRATLFVGICVSFDLSQRRALFLVHLPKRICWWRFRPLIILSDILGTPMTYIPMQILCKYAAYQFWKFEEGLASHSRTKWLAEIKPPAPSVSVTED